MKITLFRYDTRFFSYSSLFDDRRHPRRIAPAADQEQTIQKPLPAVHRRGHETGFHRKQYFFHGSEVTPWTHARFYRLDIEKIQEMHISLLHIVPKRFPAPHLVKDHRVHFLVAVPGCA